MTSVGFEPVLRLAALTRRAGAGFH